MGITCAPQRILHKSSYLNLSPSVRMSRPPPSPHTLSSTTPPLPLVISKYTMCATREGWLCLSLSVTAARTKPLHGTNFHTTFVILPPPSPNSPTKRDPCAPPKTNCSKPPNPVATESGPAASDRKTWPKDSHAVTYLCYSDLALSSASRPRGVRPAHSRGGQMRTLASVHRKYISQRDACWSRPGEMCRSCPAPHSRSAAES